MKKNVLIRKNNEFILITYFLEGMISITDPEQEFCYLPTDISYSDLGKYIKAKLAKSRSVDFEEFQGIFHSEKIKNLTKMLEKEMKERFFYKNKKDIYKNMSFLSVEIQDDKLMVIPWHQDSVSGYTAIEDKDKNWVKFEYSSIISDEKLGEVVINAFKCCTSIYR